MQKLIEKYLANPSAKLAEKIKAYEHKGFKDDKYLLLENFRY